MRTDRTVGGGSDGWACGQYRNGTVLFGFRVQVSSWVTKWSCIVLVCLYKHNNVSYNYPFVPLISQDTVASHQNGAVRWQWAPMVYNTDLQWVPVSTHSWMCTRTRTNGISKSSLDTSVRLEPCTQRIVLVLVLIRRGNSICLFVLMLLLSYRYDLVYNNDNFRPDP